MVKTTKRSRKFNAKTGGASSALQKGVSLTKKGKTKRGGGGKAGGTPADRSKGENNEQLDKAKQERISSDVLNMDNLGALDIDSFFEKAVGGLGNESDEEEEDGANIIGATKKTKSTDDDDDESSVDSYTSLGSEEMDVAASEAQMKAQIQKLSSQDPEFHKYLKENESSLLEFGDEEDSDDDGMGEDDMNDDEEEYVQDEDAMESILNTVLDDNDEEEEGVIIDPSKGYSTKQFLQQQKEAENKFLLTPQRLTQLEQGAFTSHSIKGLKRIIGGYRTACHLSDANGQDTNKNAGDNSDEEEQEDVTRNKKKEFQITSPVVFDRLMAVCLSQCYEEFYYHLLKADDDKKKEEEEGMKNGKGGEKDEESSSSSGSDSSDGDSSEEGGEDKPKKKLGKEQREKKDKTSSQQVPPTKAALDENKPLHPKRLAKSPHWLAIRPLIESFLKSTLHILNESGKEAKLLRFVLQALSKYIPYLTAFPKLVKPYLKTLVGLWSAPLDSSEEYNTVRLQAFLRIRQLAITQPYPLIEDVLKLTYLSYANCAKFGTAANVSSTLPTLTFMGNCIVELYTLDYGSAYQHVFIYVRQLALHLRNAMMKQTGEARGAVTCWQFVHCLKLWVAVLCAACGSSNLSGSSGDNHDDGGTSQKLGGGINKDEEANLLRSLVYPLTEIILGACRLVPVVRFVPLRLHLVRLLQQLAACTETFIPTTSLLLGVLDLKEVGMKPLRDGSNKGKGKKNKGSSSSGTVRGLRLPLILKLPKENTLRTMEQLDSVLKETFVLLNREMDMYRYNPGFPEFTFAILQRLRKFNKEISNGRWRAYSKGTMELCDKYSTFAINGRSTLNEAPKDVRRLEALKPANIPSMRERYENAIGKEKRLEAATQPAMKASNKNAGGDKVKSKRKRKGGEANDSDSEEEKKEVSVSKKSKPKKKKTAVVVNEADLQNVDALKEEDQVAAGIWSESESDSD